MSGSKIPFNITLLELNDNNLSNLRPVTVLDTFDGATKNFHESGLFSVATFGKIGDERRNRRFSFIDIKIKIFHPVVFRALTKLKQFYFEIITGKSYAVWNDELKDFEKSTPMDGNTGFNFFASHWEKIVFEARPSISREQNIGLIEKFKSKAMLSKIIVMPAGLRDFEIQGDGRESKDEINDFYIKILSLTNSITESAVKNNPELLNNIRTNLQLTFNQIYDYIENMIQGKKKLMMGKWASRKVFNGTRNVITAMDTSSEKLDSKGNISVNNTIIGLYQFLKASMPVSRFNIKNNFLSKVFFAPNAEVALVNKTTLKKEMVKLKPYYYDIWMTDEGLEKVISSFKEEGVRHSHLEIEGYYVGLIYKGPDGTYKLMQDINELPDSRLKEHVFPITFCELLYLSVYKTANTLPIYVTRYPITGFGSIYPSFVFLKPTVKTEIRKELDDNWEITDDDNIAYQFPITNSNFIESMSPAPSHLGRMGGDFDGDTVSGTIVYSDESITEVKKYINSKKYYVGSNGKMSFSSNTDTIDYVVQNMTG